jgi:predicted DNA-binding transcriptional regulator YafY
MSLLKSIERLKRMDYFIRMEATGTSDEFAEKIGISRSTIMENLREMKELGAKLNYCHRRRSYYYENEFRLIVGDSSKQKLTGGMGKIFPTSLPYLRCA